MDVKELALKIARRDFPACDAHAVVSAIEESIEQLQAKVAELEAEVERLSDAHVKACQANADSQAELAAEQEEIANGTAEAIARMLENGSFLTPESRVALAANSAAKAIRNGAWKEFKK